MIDEAKTIITRIREMETSLDDSKGRRDYDSDDVTITYPLNHCLQTLREKQTHIARLHRERFEQIKSMLESQFQRLELLLKYCRARSSTRVVLVAS